LIRTLSSKFEEAGMSDIDDLSKKTDATRRVFPSVSNIRLCSTESDILRYRMRSSKHRSVRGAFYSIA
jgi:hypothetical protein